MSERHARLLARLSDLSLALAEDLQAAALAAEDPAEKAQLASAFHKVARGARQSMALEAKLARDADQAQREQAAEDDRTRPIRVMARSTQVGQAVERLLWTEAEDQPELNHACEVLREILDAYACEPDFLDAPLDELAQRIKTEIFQLLRETEAGEDVLEPAAESSA